MRVPSLASRSPNVPGIRASSSLAMRSPNSSSRSTSRAAAMRASEPKALTSTGMSLPSTRSNSSATLPSPGVLDTGSTISVISRSRDTGAVTRRRRPSFSRRARKSRRSVNAIDLFLVEDLDEPAGQDGEREARYDAHGDEAPAHQRRLPGDDPLQAKERPRGHVGNERRRRHAGVGEHHHEGHTAHWAAGRARIERPLRAPMAGSPRIFEICDDAKHEGHDRQYERGEVSPHRAIMAHCPGPGGRHPG